MNKVTVLSLSLCLALFGLMDVNAQQPLFSGSSSAGNTINPVVFNCDYSGTPGDGISLHYKGQNDASFSQSLMSPVSDLPYYEYTYETAIGFTGTPGNVEYYFSTTQDLNIITQSPKNSTNQFPPPAYKYAQFIPDAQGDMAGGSAGSWLDITSNGMTYSDNKIFCYLHSVSATYPQSQLFTYFVYTDGFMITSGPDSAFYAMVYANVPLLLSTGLFKLNLVDSSYTRLGNISSTISGGNLHMSCDISVLATDPGWPGWPPPEGYIIPMAATLTADISNQFVNDNSYPAIFIPQTQFLNFAVNNPPGLFSGNAVFDSGVSITPRITYNDSDNNLPIISRFHFDSDLYEMKSSDHIYSDSSEFITQLAWPTTEGWHHYFCEFSDGVDTVLSAPDSLLVPLTGCAYVTGDANGSSTFTGLDITYSVRFFKGGPVPPLTCECTPGHIWYVAGDVNGSCSFSGLDITYMVRYFKGGPGVMSCPDCPPVGILISPNPINGPDQGARLN
ncbi:MAG TPA: hypothetical protein DCZ43_04475 [candidate division Zixibacteria bacterium]|nr:hypothetical protein [candidate division Zixibacteria bacterium]